MVVVDGEPTAVFTGGSLLYGTVGRTDLIDDDATEELTRSQYRSVHRLADELPGGTSVLPTHGFGSFCSSASSSGADSSTISCERDTNMALTTADEDTFVDDLLAGLTAYPRYYAHIAPRNRQGPGPIDLSPPEPVDPAEIRRRTVLDVRRPDEYDDDHLAHALHIPLYQLEERMGEVPSDGEIWVHCASGYRASIAASLVDRSGRTVVAVHDSFQHAADIEVLRVSKAE